MFAILYGSNQAGFRVAQTLSTSFTQANHKKIPLTNINIELKVLRVFTLKTRPVKRLDLSIKILINGASKAARYTLQWWSPKNKAISNAIFSETLTVFVRLLTQWLNQLSSIVIGKREISAARDIRPSYEIPPRDYPEAVPAIPSVEKGFSTHYTSYMDTDRTSKAT